MKYFSSVCSSLVFVYFPEAFADYRAMQSTIRLFILVAYRK